eukprot:3528385-Amphidinium_carterae.1
MDACGDHRGSHALNLPQLGGFALLEQQTWHPPLTSTSETLQSNILHGVARWWSILRSYSTRVQV